MKKTIVLIVLSLSALTLAAQDNRGFFIGGAVGSSDLGGLVPPEVSSETGRDDSDTMFELFAGYQFSQYFGVEAGILELGELTIDPWSNSGLRSYEAAGYRFMGYGRLPLGRFALVGKAGWFASDYDQDFFDGETFSDDDLTFGWEFGAQFDLTQDWILSLDVATYDLEFLNSFDPEVGAFNGGDEGEVDIIKVGIRYLF